MTDIRQEIEKWFKHWIRGYFLHPEAFDEDLRESVVLDELEALFHKSEMAREREKKHKIGLLR